MYLMFRVGGLVSEAKTMDGKARQTDNFESCLTSGGSYSIRPTSVCADLSTSSAPANAILRGKAAFFAALIQPRRQPIGSRAQLGKSVGFRGLLAQDRRLLKLRC